MTEKEMIADIHSKLTTKINGKDRFDKIDEMWEAFVVKQAFKKRNKFMVTVIGASGGAIVVAISKIIEVLA